MVLGLGANNERQLVKMMPLCRMELESQRSRRIKHRWLYNLNSQCKPNQRVLDCDLYGEWLNRDCWAWAWCCAKMMIIKVRNFAGNSWIVYHKYWVQVQKV
jgi:hypothetical protein